MSVANVGAVSVPSPSVSGSQEPTQAEFSSAFSMFTLQTFWKLTKANADLQAEAKEVDAE